MGRRIYWDDICFVNLYFSILSFTRVGLVAMTLSGNRCLKIYFIELRGAVFSRTLNL